MIQLDVTIMGQGYRLACREGEERILREAVAYLDEKMCSIRDAGKIRGNDRIAVMASLAIAGELLATKSPNGPLSEMSMFEIRQKMEAMNRVLDQALMPQEDLF